MQPQSPTPKPVMVYDGDCGFCRFWIERWRRRLGDAVAYRPYQEAAASFPQIDREDFAAAVHLIEADGRVTRGAAAVARALWWGGRRLPWRLVSGSRIASRAAEASYSLVARHRPLFTLATRLLWGRDPRPASWSLTASWFLRGLGLIYLAAFLSLLMQIDGLIGPQGLLPAERYLDLAFRQLGSTAYRLLPSLAWLHPGGNMPLWICAAGVAVSLLLVAGVASRAALISLWVLYLSLVSIGQDFLSFQWDALLLETGFLAIFLAPPGWWTARRRREPPAAALWLLRWLVFRLYFMSGMVKLLSGDPLWRDLSALTVHYQTQPLPHRASWLAHQLPDTMHLLACLAMLGVELVLPFLVWLPRRPRLLAAMGFALLQCAILATGNYGFFNLLSLLLGLALVDDRTLRQLLPGSRQAAATPPPFPGRRARLAGIAAWALAGLGLMVMLSRLAAPLPLPGPARQVMGWLAPFRLANAYGLFAVMTPTRPEIIVEGSRDGRQWLPYRWRWKPADPLDPPRWATPHMPRLDWQMWFAALSPGAPPAWFASLLQALLEGRPEVLDLLAENPFPDGPPRYVRALLHDYAFADPGDAAWWQRRQRGIYTRAVQLPAVRRPTPNTSADEVDRPRPIP